MKKYNTSALDLAFILKSYDITDIVVCPGSRNVPLITTFADDPVFNCIPVTDERNAGFIALGMCIQKKTPIVVCCTSGSAVLNLYPAVAEAYYQHMPLIIVSADRPAEWIGQNTGQTLPQPGVFGSMVKKAVNIPVMTYEDDWYGNRLMNEAMIEIFTNPRPVHINIQIGEPFYEDREQSPFRERVIFSVTTGSDQLQKLIVAEMKNMKKKMVLIGQRNDQGNDTGVLPASLRKSFVWLADALSNEDDYDVISNYDTILYKLTEKEKDALRPELLITYGGDYVSKRVKEYFRKYPPSIHFDISPDNEVRDPFQALTTQFTQMPSTFWESFTGEHFPSQTVYNTKWANLSRAIPKPAFPYSAMSAIGRLMEVIPPESTLHLANSSTIRYALLYPTPVKVKVRSNRGVNGIEGSLAEAVGGAIADSEHLHYLIIGDLSFFDGMNVLGTSLSIANLRIMLINNGGGELMEAIHSPSVGLRSLNLIKGTHTTTAKAWAEGLGFTYFAVENDEELERAVLLMSSGGQSAPILTEVFTHSATDIELYKDYYHQLKNKKRNGKSENMENH